jgi:hypothetical protein
VFLTGGLAQEIFGDCWVQLRLGSANVFLGSKNVWGSSLGSGLARKIVSYINSWDLGSKNVGA